MAGNYPDPPGHRMAIDKDGTIGVIVSPLGVVTQLSGPTVVGLNDESGAFPSGHPSFGGGSVPWYMVLIFPELRDVSGVFISEDTGAIMHNRGSIEVSPDSTWGLDGSWSTAIAASGDVVVWDGQNYRTGVLATSQIGVRAIRYGITGGSSNAARITSFHVYGDRSAGANPNRLEIWDPSVDQKIAAVALDWGNVPRSSSEDRTFRVKNMSASLTANDIVIGFDALTDTSPSVPGQHLLSADGLSFASTEDIASLAPGAISPVFHLRRVTPSNATLGLWVARLNATATTWS